MASDRHQSLLSATEKKIARRIAQLRKDHELTLQALSRQTGLSESYLSRVENLKAAISISGLTRLADAFGVPMGSFFDSETFRPRVQLSRAGEGQVHPIRGREGILIRLLANGVKGRIMEPFVVDVQTAKAGAPLQSHEGEEFIYVLKGRCALFLGDEHYEFKTGDSVYFDSGVHHRIEPLDRRACEVLSVVTSRDFTFHGNLARLMND